VLSEESHNDYVFLIGVGASLTERLYLGCTSKVVLRSLAGYSAWGLGADAGLQYSASKVVSLGATVTNMTSTFISYDNGTTESIIPALRLGIAATLPVDDFELQAAVDGDLLFEGRDRAAQVSLGTASLDAHFGGEIGYHQLVFLRGGADIDRLTLGVGIKFNRFRIDGAFMDHSDLDNSYRVSLNIKL
jgi:hypothetical protein